MVKLLLFIIRLARRMPLAQGFAQGMITHPSLLDAIDWIQLQEELSNLGYSQQQVKALYVIQSKEWRREQETYGANGLYIKSALFSQAIFCRL
jgi:hypothetical protein